MDQDKDNRQKHFIISGNVEEVLQKGLVFHGEGKLDLAVELYKKILKAAPENGNALHLLGLTRYSQKDFAVAEDLIRRAILALPNQAVFHHNLASVLSTMGDLEGSKKHYRQAIFLKMDYAEAFYNLSAIIKLSKHDPLVDQARSLLKKNDLAKTDRCFLHFALGKWLDDAGQYDEAFIHYKNGNLLKDAKYNKNQTEDLFDQMVATATPRLLSDRMNGGIKTKLPVFIVGMPRSGTSLVEQILSGHSAVHGAGELPYIRSITLNLKDRSGVPSRYPMCLRHLEASTLNSAANDYLREIFKLSHDAKRIIDKHPINFWHVGLIVSMFSNAQIIHCQRDPLDTCLSCYFQNFTNGQEYSFDFEDLAHFYNKYIDMMAHWRNALPMSLLEIRYEDLVSNTEEVAREILTYLGLEWENTCIAPHQTNRPVQTASRWQVRQPVYKTSQARWRRYEKHISPLRDRLGDLIR